MVAFLRHQFHGRKLSRSFVMVAIPTLWGSTLPLGGAPYPRGVDSTLGCPRPPLLRITVSTARTPITLKPRWYPATPQLVS